MTEKEFITLLIKEIKEAGLKSFPDDFVQAGKTSILHTGGKTLVIGNEIFGAFEIITTDGTPFYLADNYNLAKYIVYASQNKPSDIYIPEVPETVKESVRTYEEYLKSIVKETSLRHKKEFPEGSTPAVTNEIFRRLNLVIY